MTWVCQRSGDCCTQPSEVVLTEAELRAIVAITDRRLHVRHRPDGFWTLAAGPCPLYDAETGCTVYAVRPYNCRRFACLRADPTHTPFTGAGIPETRAERRQLVQIQRKAQRWAVTHSWRADADHV